MATTQDTLMSIQKELENLDIQISYYKHYQYADKGLSLGLRRIILEYNKTKNDEVLIQELNELIDYHEMMMRRYVPRDPCCGVPKGLCKIHYLPLFVTKWTKDGEPLVLKCNCSP